MITVRQLAQQAMRIVAGGDQSDQSAYDEGYFMRMVREAANTVIKPMILDNMANDDRSTLPMLIVRYTVAVQEDQSGFKFIKLPEFYQQLPFNKGLKGIAPVENPDAEFIPRHNAAVSIGLPCADAEQQQSYSVEGLTAYFDKELELGFVIVKLLVVAPDSIANDDPLPLYPEHQVPIIQMVVQMYGRRVPVDNTLNHNPNN